MTAVRQIEPSAKLRSLGTLPRVDYADAFAVDGVLAQSRSPEEWARAVFEGLPASRRRALRTGWTSLGLKLGPVVSDRTVEGWELRRSDPDVAILGADSRIGMPAELFVERGEDCVLFGTLVQQRNWVARRLWAAITAFHQRVVKLVLERGLADE